MARSESKSTAKVENKTLYTVDPATTGITVGSVGWFSWLQLGETFSFDGCTWRAEKRRNGMFWYVYRKFAGKLHKRYAGASDRLHLLYLQHVASMLNAEHPI